MASPWSPWPVEEKCASLVNGRCGVEDGHTAALFVLALKDGFWHHDDEACA